MKKLDDVNTKINLSKYIDVYKRRLSKYPIVKVRCTKPRSQTVLTMNLSRKDDIGEYP